MSDHHQKTDSDSGQQGHPPATSPSEKEKTPHIVYFSSATNNTARFVEKLGFPSQRIPLRRKDPEITVTEPYVLIVPTYGGGNVKGAVPKQVITFLNEKDNRDKCLGVIASGNTNFNTAYAIAGNIVAQKLKVPFMYKFELLGTSEDVQKCKEGLVEFWQKI
ncbi:MAG: class Ib ribonucleoside-diphosphate reductase assembly flavoprotein NrdI [Actinomycetaceae bacterium]|nr:class Ib ribonucleoside-diphosphate reductase assembly flavoprotein NrdI [Actinomycetaceae bacterium]